MIMVLFTNIPCAWINFNIVNFSLDISNLIIDCVIDIIYSILEGIYGRMFRLSIC